MRANILRRHTEPSSLFSTPHTLFPPKTVESASATLADSTLLFQNKMVRRGSTANIEISGKNKRTFGSDFLFQGK
jgi:hypothetical protein